MRYVILRDDDTNAFTPADCLERLYRPFHDRGLPVNLAVIPEVRTDAVGPDGTTEGFLRVAGAGVTAKEPTQRISGNRKLVEYLHANPGFHIAQHGWDHSLFEFDSMDADA